MKKIALAFIVGAMSGCGPDPEPSFKYNYTVINTAGFGVSLSCQGCETVIVATDGQKQVKTNTLFEDYLISPTSPTSRKLHSEEGDTDEWIIRSFEYDIIYKVKGGGDNQTVDVTLTNSSGNQEQFINVALPVMYQFRDFTSEQASISAVKNTGTGPLTVEIHYREIMVSARSSVSSGTVSASALLTEID